MTFDKLLSIAAATGVENRRSTAELENPDGGSSTQAQHGLAPTYVSELLPPDRPSHALRLGTDSHLLLESMTCSSWGDQAFNKTAPVLWNALPHPIRTADSLDTFEATLKT